ncbi:MAG: radical SAM peptide maturase, CXXX-repeat target family [Bacteroidales bacterium]
MEILRSTPGNFAEQPTAWNEKNAKTITFIVTEDCQLRCKYCYIPGKNSLNRMTFEVAKNAVDYILENKTLFKESSVVWDFIGGEPFLEIELIIRICDYIKVRMFELNHPWFNSYRFNFSTNGINYAGKLVQQFIERNKTHLSIGISVDGTREKHDSQRIFPGGKGSYDQVSQNIPLWLSQFPDASTKATVSHDDLPFVKESVLHLWKTGIKNVNINVVFEDAWHDGDDLLFESQLRELADVIVEEKLFEQYSCSFFNDEIGKPVNPELDNQNWCGAGKMLAIDHLGNFYPCMRFAAYSLNNHPPVIIGNAASGIDQDKLRPYLSLTRTSQSTQECIGCDVASGCAWCIGFNYDMAVTPTIYQRATFICKMHKARVRANNYFRNRLNETTEQRQP